MGTQGFKSFANKIKRADRKLKRDARDAVSNAGRQGVITGKRKIIDQDAVASTDLFRNMQYKRVPSEGDTIARATLFNDTPYAAYVDQGTGTYGPWPAGAPSPRVILNWMRIKPSFTMPSSFSVRIAVAREIAANIRERGTKPRPFWEDAKDSARNRLISDMHRSLRSAF